MRPSSALGTLLAASLLVGCASTGGSTDTGATGRLADGAARTARHSPGGASVDAARAEDEGFRVVATYRAASGRLCRRLADADGVVIARVSCLRASGEWALGRSLDGRSPGTVASPLPSDEPLLSPVVPGDEEHSLVDIETGRELVTPSSIASLVR